MLGLETKKNQERNVYIKENESLIKLVELSNKIDEVEYLFIDDHHEVISKLFDNSKQLVKDEFMTIRGTVAKLNKKIDSLTEHYNKVLGSIYQLLCAICLKERISKKELESGLLDELPVRFKSN